MVRARREDPRSSLEQVRTRVRGSAARTARHRVAADERERRQSGRSLDDRPFRAARVRDDTTGGQMCGKLLEKADVRAHRRRENDQVRARHAAEIVLNINATDID